MYAIYLIWQSVIKCSIHRLCHGIGFIDMTKLRLLLRMCGFSTNLVWEYAKQNIFYSNVDVNLIKIWTSADFMTFFLRSKIYLMIRTIVIFKTKRKIITTEHSKKIQSDVCLMWKWSCNLSTFCYIAWKSLRSGSEQIDNKTLNHN